MRSAALLLLLTLSGCQSNVEAKINRCLPGVAQGKAQGLVMHVSAEIHGDVTSLLSENCKLVALSLDFDPADQARVDALTEKQNPGAWLLDGKIASIDYVERKAKLAPGVKIELAPNLTGDDLYYRFKDGKPLR